VLVARVEGRATLKRSTRRTCPSGSGTYSSPEERHADVLRCRPFRHVDAVNRKWQLPRDPDSVVGLRFSYSAPTQRGAKDPS
jgi:hypothetical protein